MNNLAWLTIFNKILMMILDNGLLFWPPCIVNSAFYPSVSAYVDVIHVITCISGNRITYATCNVHGLHTIKRQLDSIGLYDMPIAYLRMGCIRKSVTRAWAAP